MLRVCADKHTKLRNTTAVRHPHPHHVLPLVARRRCLFFTSLRIGRSEQLIQAACQPDRPCPGALLTGGMVLSSFSRSHSSQGRTPLCLRWGFV